MSPERLRVPEFLITSSGSVLISPLTRPTAFPPEGMIFVSRYRPCRIYAQGPPVCPWPPSPPAGGGYHRASWPARPPAYRASFNRPNLFYQVTKTGSGRPASGFSSGTPGRTRQSAAPPARTSKPPPHLSEKGIAALAYHAGLPDAERRAAQDAVGAMRLDRGHRSLWHGRPTNANIEQRSTRIAQEFSGYCRNDRAGRDGKAPAASCSMAGTMCRAHALTEGVSRPDAEAARRQLFRMLDFTQKEGCRRKALLDTISTVARRQFGGCDICAGEAERTMPSPPRSCFPPWCARAGALARTPSISVLRQRRAADPRFLHQGFHLGVGRLQDAACLFSDSRTPFWPGCFSFRLHQVFPTPAHHD